MVLRQTSILFWWFDVGVSQYICQILNSPWGNLKPIVDIPIICKYFMNSRVLLTFSPMSKTDKTAVIYNPLLIIFPQATNTFVWPNYRINFATVVTQVYCVWRVWSRHRYCVQNSFSSYIICASSGVIDFNPISIMWIVYRLWMGLWLCVCILRNWFYFFTNLKSVHITFRMQIEVCGSTCS